MLKMFQFIKAAVIQPLCKVSDLGFTDVNSGCERLKHTARDALHGRIDRKGTLRRILCEDLAIQDTAQSQRDCKHRLFELGIVDCYGILLFRILQNGHRLTKKGRQAEGLLQETSDHV